MAGHVETQPEAQAGYRLRVALIAGLIILFFVGTLFFTVPQGLSAMAQSLPAYLQTWLVPSATSFGLLFAALLLYELFPFVFGLVALISHWRDPLVRFLGLWWAAALLLALVHPGRQVNDLAWSLLPLWALASIQFAGMLRLPAQDRLPAIGQMILAFVVLVFAFMDLITITNGLQIDQNQIPEWFALAGALILLVAITLLVGWGWSMRVAGTGLVWAISLALLLFTISASVHAAAYTSRRVTELWYPGPVFKDRDLMRDTITDLSKWNTGVNSQLDLAVVDVPSPALEWTLRSLWHFNRVDYLPASAAPALVITADQPDLGLGATYRGQDFILAQAPSWSLMQPYEWIRWAVFREAPLENTLVVLWARTDLFPDGEEQSSSFNLDSNNQIVPK